MGGAGGFPANHSAGAQWSSQGIGIWLAASWKTNGEKRKEERRKRIIIYKQKT